MARSTKHSATTAEAAPAASTNPLPGPAAGPPGDATTDAATKTDRAAQADKIIRDAVAWSCAGGLIPVPLFDIAAITASQLKLVRELSKLYEVPFEDHLGRNVVASLVGSIGSAAVGRGIFCSVLKAVPVIGTIGGLISVPIVAGASTYALGKVFISHFESGGTLLDFKPEPVREFFEAKFREGQQVARDMKDRIAKSNS